MSDTAMLYTRLRVADILTERGITIAAFHRLLIRQEPAFTMNYASLHGLLTGVTRNASLDAIGAIARTLHVNVGVLFEDVPGDSPTAVAEIARQQQYAAATKRRRESR